MKSAIALEANQFNKIIETFRKRKDLRMACLCSLLGARAMRIGDVLSLTIEMLYTPSGDIRQDLRMKEQKNLNRKKPERVIPIWNEGNEGLKELLAEYFNASLKTLPQTAYMFCNAKRGTVLTRQGAAKLIKEFVGVDAIESRQACPHGLRKHAGRKLWKAGVSIETISRVYFHGPRGMGDPITTMAYLSISPVEVAEAWGKLMA